MKIVTCYATKGGVAKTTTAVNIAATLAAAGHETLLIDLDANGHCALQLNLAPSSAAYQWFAEPADRPLIQPEQVLIATTQPNLKLLAANGYLRQIERLYFGEPNAPRLLANRIAALAAPTTAFIVIDTAIASGVLRDAAFIAADTIVTPFQPSPNDLALITTMLKSVTEQRVILLPTRVKHTVLHRQIIAQANARWGAYLVQNGNGPVKVVESTTVEEAAAMGQPLLQYSPSHTATHAYRKIAEEL